MKNSDGAPKPSVLLEVGEVSDDRIGCFLFGVEMPDGSNPSYHSLAIRWDELVDDCRIFLTNLADRKRELISQGSPTAPRHQQDLKVIVNAIGNLELFVNMHLTQGGDTPFLELPGMRIFLRRGERLRQKIRGEYVE